MNIEDERGGRMGTYHLLESPLSFLDPNDENSVSFTIITKKIKKKQVEKRREDIP